MRKNKLSSIFFKALVSVLMVASLVGASIPLMPLSAYASTPLVIQVVTGYNGVSTLMNDGTVKVWGYNGSGQLGLGDLWSRLSPVTVPGLTGVKQLVPGYWNTFAMMNDGTVKAWGDNSYGEFGLGNTTSQSRPVTVPGLTGVKQLVAGYFDTFALMSEGTVKAWGKNDSGQLGIGNTIQQNSPVTMPGLTGVRQLVTGYFHTFAIMNDGTVKAWGRNNEGQLGLGYTAYMQNNPVTVPGLTGVQQLIAGGYHTVALMTDGTVKTWGNNSEGELGLGNTISRSTPVTVPGLTSVQQLVAGGSDTFTPPIRFPVLAPALAGLTPVPGFQAFPPAFAHPFPRPYRVCSKSPRWATGSRYIDRL